MQQFVREQYKCWNEELLPALAKHQIRVLTVDQLSSKAAQFAKTFYDRRVCPYFVRMMFNYPALAERYKAAAFNGLNRLGQKALTVKASGKTSARPGADVGQQSSARNYGENQAFLSPIGEGWGKPLVCRSEGTHARIDPIEEEAL